ncbi:MAG: ribonuclease J [Chloroflexota bacterium]
MAKQRLRVTPLGGIGEVGKNSYVVEFGRDLLLVDAGLKFPEEEMLGIDLVIPDYSYVTYKTHNLKGILISHGHEDHIGAIPYLLPQLGGHVPIYGSDLALGLLDAKLKENGVAHLADLRPVKAGERIKLGRFLAEFFDVNHSVPGSFGLALTTPVGLLVYSGDFKFGESFPQKHEPRLDGEVGLAAKLADLGRQNVLLLMSDCVRIEQPGRTPPESVVAEALEKIFTEAPGRIIMTTFASNVARWRQAIDIAVRKGRKVAMAGRSLVDAVDVASRLDYLKIPAGTMVTLDETSRMAPNRVLLLVTGSQGEPTSILSRIAIDDYRAIRLVENDTVVIAASPVPGNEETVARTIDNLFRRGARVIYSTIAENVHVSGHASRDELRDMIELTKPAFAIPIHGEYRHMVLYRQLASETGMDPSRVLLPEPGDVLGFAPDFGEKIGQVPSGSVLVDGITVGEVTQVTLRDRRRLAQDGVLIASIVVDAETGQLVGGPDLVSRGFIRPEDSELLEKAKEALRKALKRRARGQAEYGFLVAKISDILGPFVYQATHRRPLILPVVTEI